VLRGWAAGHTEMRAAMNSGKLAKLLGQAPPLKKGDKDWTKERHDEL
jgi:hypothetical protein